MKKILLPTLLSLSFAALAAEPVANGLTYNHVGVAYGVIEFDDKSSAFKSKGYGLEASNLVTENIFIFGSFSDTKSNKAKNNGANVSMDVDFKNYSFGAGYRIPLAKGTDAYAAISGVKSKGRFNAQGESSSDRVIPPFLTAV